MAKKSGASVFHGTDEFPDGRILSLEGRNSGAAFQGTFTRPPSPDIGESSARLAPGAPLFRHLLTLLFV